jgi:hypothetical protein
MAHSGAPKKLASLGQALAYRNSQILHKFVEHYDVSLAQSRELFTETKKWLWLNAQPDAPRMVVTREMIIIDEMWHTFVLFTDCYHRYCLRNFGRFLHHRPTTKREKDRAAAQRKRDPEGFRRRRLAALATQYEFICDRLGPETAIKWYAEFPQRYDRRFFERARRAPDLPDASPATRRRLAKLVDAHAER